MEKIGRNDPCPCGSGMKFKKCCYSKKPRERIVLVGSPVPLKGLHNDKEKMEFVGLGCDGNMVQPKAVISQSHYIGDSGKEKVISRVHNKVIVSGNDLYRFLKESFDHVVGIDTNTISIGSYTVSAAYIVHCNLHDLTEDGFGIVEFPEHGVMLFCNCPAGLHPEKLGWLQGLNEMNRNSLYAGKRICVITDHDMSNHKAYNERAIPVYKNVFLPSNGFLVYGRADGSSDTMLNAIIRLCDKKSNEVLDYIKANGYYEQGDFKVMIENIYEPYLL